MTVRELVDELIRLWGSGRWEQDPADTPHEARALRLNIDKATGMLGWRPRWGIDRALASVVDWYRAFRANEGAAGIRQLGLRQIADYELSVRGPADLCPRPAEHSAIEPE